MGLSIMEALQEVTTNISTWTKKKIETGLSTKVDKVQGKVLSDNNYSQADKDKVASMPDNLVVIENMLYLAQGDNPILDSAVELPEGGGSGSGGGGTNVNVTVTDLMSSTDFSVALGSKEVWIKFNFTSSRSTTGTAYIKNSDGKILGSRSIKYGNNEIDIAEFLTDDYNVIWVVCTDSVGNSADPLIYNITVVTLSLTTSFSDAVACTGSSFTVPYRLEGDGDKIMHFIFDGVETTKVISASDINTTETFKFGSKPHGVYSLKMYADITASGTTVSSDVYNFRVMYAIGSTPLISSVCDITEATQYDTINIPFAVYHSTNEAPTVDLIANYDGVESSRKTMTAARGKRLIWSTRTSHVGDVDFTISYAGVEVTHTIKVVKSPMDVVVRQENLVFELKAADKSNDSDKDVWNSTVGDVSVDFQDVGWDVEEKTFVITGTTQDAIETKKQYAIGTGWRMDEEGNTALRLSGDARAIIQFAPFATDWMAANQDVTIGRTIEMEFAIRDVNNRDAEAISCMNNNVGFLITADSASLIRNNVPLVKCNYVDDEKIRVSFVVEKQQSGVRLITSYLNGVLSSAATFTDSDGLLQNPAQYITVGSSDCSIDLYMMRFYDVALTHNEIKNNYIADTLRGDLWADNDIYVNNAINYNKLENKIPIIRTTGIRPTTKNETKSVEKGGAGIDRRVDVIYTNKSSSPVIKEDQVKIHVQGTSSEGYIRKNYDLDFENSYQLAEDQIPTDYFCLKTDYAEATGTHNTGHANYVHNFYTQDKFGDMPPFDIDSRARTTIYGFPCVIFHRDSSSDSYYFAGKYNFNFSKDSENVFGFTATDDNGNPRYPKAQSWEFAENKYDPCKFLTDPDEIPDGKGTDGNPGWEKCFEDRYLYDDGDMEDFKRMYRWVYYTDQTKANPDSTIDPYTQQPIGEYLDPFDNTTIHTHDTAAYRLAKFRKEFEEHFHLGFTLVYYVYTFVMLMVDQRAKNQFLTSWDGEIWCPWLYDNDFVKFFNMVVVKPSLINGENPEMDNAQEDCKFRYFYTKEKEVQYVGRKHHW